jgi:hypothetical protein
MSAIAAIADSTQHPYGALGAPGDVAATIRAYHDAGVRHISLDFAGPYERRHEQLEWFANEVRPLLQDLM